MHTKKLLTAAFILVVLSVFALQAGAEVVTGTLAKSGTSEANFNASIQDAWLWNTVEPDHKDGTSYRFYDSLTAMQLAMNALKINEIELPKFVGEYITAINKEYRISCTVRIKETDFVFGFLRGERGFDLQRRFNEALASLRANGHLEAVREKYTKNMDLSLIQPVEFTKFEGAETIKVAVTGDVPPIDYVSPEGEAAGFNTALLSEVAKYLKVNIELVRVETAAKTPALTSGRVDAVFWYQYTHDADTQSDIPEDIIISEPYYSWDILVHVRLK